MVFDNSINMRDGISKNWPSSCFLELGDDFHHQRRLTKEAGEAESFARSQDTSGIRDFDTLDESVAQMTEGLVNSCKQGHLEGVRKFLDDGYVDTEFGDSSATLIMTVKGGSVEVTKLLLSAGASIYRVNCHGETAFARAVRCEDTTL